MGAESLKTAVTDAGPLIHLAEIDCLPLLCIFDALHIPDAVWSECIEYGRVQEADILALTCVHRHTLTQISVSRFIQEKGLGKLQAGEVECLYLCQQIGVSIFLTDDLAAREAAKRQALTPVGSLGIAVRAYRTGHISQADAERHIAELYDTSSLFVTRTIVELAIEQLHKHSEQG